MTERETLLQNGHPGKQNSTFQAKEEKETSPTSKLIPIYSMNIYIENCFFFNRFAPQHTPKRYSSEVSRRYDKVHFKKKNK